ncbi:MAG: hypothetical protein R6T98_04360, partial [Desulfatiglandales bacterium]
ALFRLAGKPRPAAPAERGVGRVPSRAAGVATARPSAVRDRVRPRRLQERRAGRGTGSFPRRALTQARPAASLAPIARPFRLYFFITEPEKALLDSLYMKSKGLIELLPGDVDTGKVDNELIRYYSSYYPGPVRKLLREFMEQSYEAK